MMMKQALLSREDVDKLYVPRKEGESRLICIEDWIDTSI